MTNDNKKIDFKYPLIVFFCFILFMGVLLYFFNQLHLRRVDTVTEQYVSETQDYIANNRDSLVVVFREVFADFECTTGGNLNDLPVCPSENAKNIYGMLSQDLKDFSSTVFIKRNSQNKLMMMRLSGDVSPINEYNNTRKHERNLSNLLDGKQEFLQWDDYTYEFPNKEVVVVVKDSNGQIVGAIVRGVIE